MIHEIILILSINNDLSVSRCFVHYSRGQFGRKPLEPIEEEYPSEGEYPSSSPR